MGRPTGTVTFLFSDIEGSTARWDADRKAMSAALARHDAVMRTALESHCAYVFKTMGDAFCAAFATALDAVAAALDAQRALSAEDFSAVNGLRVRIALHTGTANERDGDYFGPAVNRVSRLLAIGYGGQILISGAAADLLRGELPPHITVRDLGTHRLRDLAHPEHVHQLVAPGLPESFPPLRSLDHQTNNLPLQLTTFVGRDMVVAEIKSLIEQKRLVTLTGTGGAGKTRCALQVAAEVLDAYPDGVWLAELAPISDPTLVANAVAQALNVPGQSTRSIFDTLLAYLRRKRLLIVLDNCEHVIEGARTAASAILHDCPDVRILATSREPLTIAGEATYRMPSLEVPSNAGELVAEAALRYGAAQLFVDRALSSDNHFTLTEDNVSHVAEICRRLDGIPLAIELAAARVKVLSPQQLAQKLDERFRVLTGGDRSALPRHQTMRALIDWSHDLLSPQEQSLFRRLSVFNGGWTLDSASAVCADETLQSWDVFDNLSALVDKSLVVADLGSSRPRYRFLESTRHYAAEKLAATGERDRLRASHARYFTEFARQLEQRWSTTPTRTWEEEVESEMDNLRVALDWALTEQQDVELGAQLVSALPLYWNAHRAEGQRFVNAALASETALSAPTIAALYLTGSIVNLNSNFRVALDYAERAKAGYDALGDTHGAMRSLRWIGVSSTLLRDLERGRKSLTDSLTYFEAQGDARWANWTLESLAVNASFAGDVARARDRYDRAMSVARMQGDDFTISACVLSLAECEYEAGNVARAIDLAREAIARDRELRRPRTLANTLANLAAYLIATEEIEPAREAANEGLRLAMDDGERQLVTWAVQHLAAVAGLRGEHERCALLLGYTNTIFIASLPREYTEQSEYDAMLERLRKAIGESSLNGLLERGELLTHEEAVAEALAI